LQIEQSIKRLQDQTAQLEHQQATLGQQIEEETKRKPDAVSVIRLPLAWSFAAASFAAAGGPQSGARCADGLAPTVESLIASCFTAANFA